MDKPEQPEETTKLMNTVARDDAEALFSLGIKFRNGEDIERDYSKAFEFFSKAAELGHASSICAKGVMYHLGEGVEKSSEKAIALYREAAEMGEPAACYNLGLHYLNGVVVEKNYQEAQKLFRQSANSNDPEIYLDAIEMQDLAERLSISDKITEIRTEILSQLEANAESIPTMTHYTSMMAGQMLLLEGSPLRLGHINALNDPNEGKLLWHYLENQPTAMNPVFVGCFLPDDDSLNMWRFYSKNHQNDDACGCAITFNTKDFFNFNLLKDLPSNNQQHDVNKAFSNTGKYPKESARFYRVIYISGDMKIHGDDSNGTLKKLFKKLKDEVNVFINENKSDNKMPQHLSKLLGPLPYLLKDADYEAEKEHRIIVTHLEYGTKEIKHMEPNLEKGVPPKLYLELHRVNHLEPVKHVTLGPKAPYKEMMPPYWLHKLMSEFSAQLKPKEDFYIRVSKCAYK